MPKLFSAIVINTLTCDFKMASPNVHFFWLFVFSERLNWANRVNWKVAISSGTANSGRSASGHVAPSLVHGPCQPSRHFPRARWRSCELCHLCNISSCTFRSDVRGLGSNRVLGVRLLIITGCFSIKMLKICAHRDCNVIKWTVSGWVYGCKCG